jgi:hypothetical protein
VSLQSANRRVVFLISEVCNNSFDFLMVQGSAGSIEVTVENIQYIFVNPGQLGAEFSLMRQEAKAAANVISACN